MKLIKAIICVFVGHRSEHMLVENEIAIFTRGCGRCGCSLGMPAMWKGVASIPPPGSTEKELEDWKLYIENRQNELRNSVKPNVKNNRASKNPLPSATLNLKRNWKV